MKINVVVVAYGNTGDTISLISSLLEADENKNLMCWLNDNNDIADTQLQEKYETCSQVAYFWSGNLGFCGGVNNIIKKIDMDEESYVWFLNPDSIISKNELLDIVSACSSRAYPIFAPKLIDENGKLIESFKKKWSTFSVLSYRVLPYRVAEWIFRNLRRQPESPKPVDWLLGASVLFSSEVVRKIGLLDERFFLCADDMADYMCRAKASGYQPILVPNLTHIHKGGGSSAFIRKPALAWAYFGHVYYFKKNGSISELSLVWVVLFASICLKSVLSIIAGRNKLAAVFFYALKGVFQKYDEILDDTLRGIR